MELLGHEARCPACGQSGRYEVYTVHVDEPLLAVIAHPGFVCFLDDQQVREVLKQFDAHHIDAGD